MSVGSPFVLLSLAQQLSSDLTTKDAERKLSIDSRHVLGYRSSRPRVEVTRATGIDCRLRVFAKIRIEFSEHFAQRKSRRAFGRTCGYSLLSACP